MGTRTSAISSGAIGPGTTTVIARKSLLNSVSLTGDGTNAATVIVYDNASAATGTQLANIRVGATGNTVHAEYNPPVRADNGITIVVAGTGAVAILSYDAA